jgi:proteasome assembly chaperone (PAC2) family protein
MSSEGRPGRGGAVLGAGGLLLALCCIALPAVFGVAIGAALGGVLDAIAAVVIAVAVAVVVHRRRAARGHRC